MVLSIQTDSPTVGQATVADTSVRITPQHRRRARRVTTGRDNIRAQWTSIHGTIDERDVTVRQTVHRRAGGHVGRRQQSHVAVDLVQKTISQQPDNHRQSDGLSAAQQIPFYWPAYSG